MDAIKLFFAPPIFPDDEDKTRTAQVLNRLVLGMMGVLVLFSLAAFLVFVEKVYNLIFVLVALLMFVVGRWLIRRGRVQLASVMLVSVLWIIVVVFMSFSGGMTSIVAIFFVAATVIAGLLLGERAALIYAVACSLAGLGLVVAEASGYLPARVFPVPARAAWLDMVLCLVMTVTAMNLTLRGLRDALARARHDERALAESNRHLEAEIAERTRVQEMIRQEKEFSERLLDAIVDTVFVFDANTGKPLRWNRAFREVSGYTDAEIASKKAPDDWYGERDLAKAASVTEKLLGGAKSVVEMSLKTRDGERIPTEYAASIASDAAGNPQYIIAVGRDVTERRRAERALQESEERFRRMAENIQDGLTIVEQGKVVYVNDRACEIFGYPRDELVELRGLDIAAPEEKERLQRITREAQQTGVPLRELEYWVVRKDGSRRCVHNRYSFNRKGDEIVGRYVVTTDVTERKQTEEQVLRLQNLLQSITDSMPSALITLDSQGRVLIWNPAAERLMDKAAEQVQGQALWQTCPDLARYYELFEEVLQERRVVQRPKERLATKAGTIYHDVSVFPLELNGINGAVLRINDVTQRVQLEEMMLQSAKMASLGGLAAGVAHEINNPLGAMMQSAQVLQMALDANRPRTRQCLQRYGVDSESLGRYVRERGLWTYLEGIRDAGRRAAKIVADLLSFSRKTSSEAEPHDLNALVDRTLELAATDYDLKKKYDFRNLELVREYAADLPDIVCDGQQIQQVALNLVRNAAQAMTGELERGARDGGYQPRLILRTSARPSWVRLEVEDNGPGVPDAVQKRIFEPFFTTKEVGEGTGLGLWLCWSIVVEHHRGRIWAESGAKGGARFIVELPIGQRPRENG